MTSRTRARKPSVACVQPEERTVAQVFNESDFVCSPELAQHLLHLLAHGEESLRGDEDALYLFSGERSRVRVTVLQSPQHQS